MGIHVAFTGNEMFTATYVSYHMANPRKYVAHRDVNLLTLFTLPTVQQNRLACENILVSLHPGRDSPYYFVTVFVTRWLVKIPHIHIRSSADPPYFEVG
jgi:hypothetical protein